MIRPLRLLKPRRFFPQLLASYTALVLMLTLLIGLTAYISSTRLFTREVTQLNQDVLRQYAALIEQDVFTKAGMLYHNIVTTPTIKSDLAAFTRMDYADLARVNGIYRDFTMLTASASHFDYLEAVHFYDLNKNLIISSKHGLKYLEGQSRENYPWLSLMEREDIATRWISPPQDESFITLITAFPRSSGNRNCMGYLAVDVKRSYLEEILAAYNGSGDGRLVLLGADDTPVAPHDETSRELGTLIEAELAGDAASATTQLGGVKTVLTGHRFEQNGWRLVAAKPVDSFFAGSVRNQKILLAICLLALAAGMGVAFLFARRVNSPLQGVVGALREIFTHKNAPENEFAFINDSISTLSSQVGQLREKLQIHRPLIKYNLLSGLVHGTIVTRQDLDERLGMLGTCLDGSGFSLLLVEIDAQTLPDSERERLHLLRYELCEQLELQDGILASELTDCRIVALLGSALKETPEETARALLAQKKDRYGLRLTVCVTDVQPSPFGLAQEFSRANAALALRYYLPGVPLLTTREHCDTQPADDRYWTELTARFNVALTARDADQAQKILSEAIEGLTGLALSAEERRRRQAGFTAAVRTAARAQRQPLDVSELAATADIYHYQEIMSTLCGALCERSLRSIEEKTQAVMRYIDAHLSQDLTLDQLAEHFSLSRSYLSRTFKECTGLSLTDYITRARLLKAQELLETTGLNIEETAQRVGFHTPHYFSRKYKEAFGVSPRDHRFRQAQALLPAQESGGDSL